jgi:hypothetical protein
MSYLLLEDPDMVKNNTNVSCSCLIYLFFGGFFAFVFVAFAIFYAIRDAIYLGPFKEHVTEYSTVLDVKNPVKHSSEKKEAYIKGKIITVNNEEGEIDDIYFSLPEELRATKPENVGTIVWLEWGEDNIGSYTDGEDATVITCDVTIIDKSTATVVAERNFRGSIPPNPKRSGEDGTGSMPIDEIVAYLKTLPKK